MCLPEPYVHTNSARKAGTMNDKHMKCFRLLLWRQAQPQMEAPGTGEGAGGRITHVLEGELCQGGQDTQGGLVSTPQWYLLQITSSSHTRHQHAARPTQTSVAHPSAAFCKVLSVLLASSVMSVRVNLKPGSLSIYS